MFPQIKSVQYSRFTLQRDEEADRHVEIKLSDDDACEHAQVAEPGGSPSFRPAPRGGSGSKRLLAILALGFLLAFIVGKNTLMAFLIVFFCKRRGICP